MNPYDSPALAQRIRAEHLPDDAERHANFVLGTPSELFDFIRDNEPDVSEPLSRCFRNLAQARRELAKPECAKFYRLQAIVEELSRLGRDWFDRIQREYTEE